MPTYLVYPEDPPGLAAATTHRDVEGPRAALRDRCPDAHMIVLDRYKLIRPAGGGGTPLTDPAPAPERLVATFHVFDGKGGRQTWVVREVV